MCGELLITAVIPHYSVIRHPQVVTDIEMPEVDGFELTERIKQSTQFANLPVVIVTSLAKETDKQRGIEVGADAYIVTQQFETRALLDVIGQIV